jgi:cell division protease FtsH
MNEGAILAARENRKKVSQYDLLRSVEKVMLGPERKSHILSVREKRITAYHEMGHALIASILEFSDPVHKVSIISRGHAAGYTLKLPFEDKKLSSQREFLDDIAVSLGGYMAEKIVFGDVTTGAANDIQVSTNLARDMVVRYGMSDKLGPIALDPLSSKTSTGMITERIASQTTQSLIDEEVTKIMKTALTQAEKILLDKRSTLDNMAEELIKVETIEREDFEKLLILNGIKPKTKAQEEPIAKTKSA